MMTPEQEMVNWEKKVDMAYKILHKKFSYGEDIVVASAILAVGIGIDREIQISKE